jgi:tetratricopeptide (TPR) repeat protein
MWENTLVKFKVSSDVDSKVTAQIDRFSANPEASLANMYFQAATYYYETDKDLNKALEWVNKTLEINPAFYIMHLKAKIQGKMKDYKNAITTAEGSIAKAKEANNEDYVKLNEKAIAEWKKMK